MVFYALCIIGWIVLWFKPNWPWLAAVTVIVIAPTVFFYGYAAFEAGVGVRGALINMINQMPFPFAVFALPGVGIVALRQWLLSRKKEPSPPS